MDHRCHDIGASAFHRAMCGHWHLAASSHPLKKAPFHSDTPRRARVIQWGQKLVRIPIILPSFDGQDTLSHCGDHGVGLQVAGYPLTESHPNDSGGGEYHSRKSFRFYLPDPGIDISPDGHNLE